ncbi:MAG: ribosomal protein S18 acetylase RimI-like enzyme [Maribacter sp.]|jgi:ribosomal protein S18 acetylase RimI-like enzyme
MISFRQASKEDYGNIATLHATNWQQNYRKCFSDYFLDYEVHLDRQIVWKERCLNPSANQYILLAEEERMLLGFCCAYVDESPLYGSYLDNLHVSAMANGKGLGTLLMQGLINEITTRAGMDKMYLWVLDSNDAAINFYDKLKGRRAETLKADDIGDIEFWKIRYVWDDLVKLKEVVNAKLQQYEHRRI